MRGLRLYVERERLPATGEREWYEADLIGLAGRRHGRPGLGEGDRLPRFRRRVGRWRCREARRHAVGDAALHRRGGARDRRRGRQGRGRSAGGSAGGRQRRRRRRSNVWRADGADALPGDVSGPAGREPGRQGVEGRRVVAGGGRYQAVRQGSPWHGRRCTLRRRRRHGDEARRAVGGDRSGRRAGSAEAAAVARAVRRSVRRAGGSWRRVRAWCWCADGSRASTSGSSRPRRWRRFRSAISCFRAARSRPWR